MTCLLNNPAIDRIELTITGPGNDLTFTDIDQNRVSYRYTIPGDQIDAAVLNAAQNLRGLILAMGTGQAGGINVGENPIVAEVNALLGNVSYVEYQLTTEDGAQLSLIPEIGITFIIQINLGAGLEIRKTRELIYEEGVILNGQPYHTASYHNSVASSQPGKSWLELVSNAAGGIWDLVKDAFTWSWRQVVSGASWSLGIVAKTESGSVRGGAEVITGSDVQLSLNLDETPAVTLAPTQTITVTAVAWLPLDSSASSQVDLNAAHSIASGSSFVVGGIYEFQPQELVFSPGATLVITYTDEALGGVPEEQLGLFRWYPEESNWQPVPAQANLASNVFTATIGTLGVFALGIDNTPPEIAILEPTDGDTVANRFPLLRVRVSDTGTGVDPETVTMQINGQPVPATYKNKTGELWYIPGVPLSNGVYAITVRASDVVGNMATAEFAFTVEKFSRIYLPIAMR